MEATFKSRYGDPRTVVRLNENQYVISGPSNYGRAGNSPNGKGLGFVDMEGGPFIAVGDDISFFMVKGDKRRITKVEFDPNEKREKYSSVIVTVGDNEESQCPTRNT